MPTTIGSNTATNEMIEKKPSTKPIAPKTVSHYHLYWGDDRAKVLEELTNWPTYYPASYSGDDIVHEMIAH